MSESRTKNSVRNMVYGFILKFLVMVIPFITRTIILKFLGAEYLGVGTLFNSILTFLSLAELGVGSAIVYEMYKPIAVNDTAKIKALLNYYKKLYRVIGLIVLIIGGLLIPFLPYLIKDGSPQNINIYLLYIIYLINSVISYFVAGYKQSLLIAYQRYDIINKISIIITIFTKITEIVALIITRSLYIYAVILVVGTVLTNIINLIVTNKKWPELFPEGDVEPVTKHSITKKLGGLVTTKLNSIVINQADNIVISAFLGLTVVAEYGNYFYIQSAVCGFITIVFSSITASVGNKIATSSLESVYELFNRLNFLNAWIVGWSTICLGCLYQPFMILWVGETYLLPFSTMLLITLHYFICVIQNPILCFKDAAGLWYEDRYRPVVGMTFNVITNIILVNIWGLNGVIASTLIAYCITVPWANRTVFKFLFKMSPRKNMAFILGNLMITTLIGSITFYICSFIQMTFVGFIEKIVVCIIVPNLLYLLVFHRKKEFKWYFEFARTKLKDIGK